jgi:predicted RNA binding protein YcfA (HicA-like mRNA interferase family)
MSRLPQLTAAQMVRTLKRAGFVAIEHRGSHLTLAHPQTGATTTVPVHPGEMKRWLVKAIIRQSGLSEEDFRAFL